MKKLNFLLICLLISSFSFSQFNSQWDESYGGRGTDQGRSAVQTPDGGFIVVGSTDSEGSGGLDGYIIKVNRNGEMDWTETYGGKKDDEFFDIVEINGNYAICGYSESKGSGKKDFWLMLVDIEGKKMWEYFYGKDKDEEAFNIIKTFDNNLVMAGYTKSKGAGGRDAWVIKVNPNGVGKKQGAMIWSRNFGGNGTDFATTIKQSPIDSFFHVIGHTTSFGEGGMDIYFVRMTPEKGGVKGKHYFGKTNFEHGNDYCFDDKGGFILVGGTMSNSKGYFDGHLYKIEDEYYKEWTKSYGGLKEDEFVNIYPVEDGYVLGGFTMSFGEGKSDAWLMKVDKKGNTLREKTYGEGGNDHVNKMIRTKDGGYLFIGHTDSKGEGKIDIWLVKIK